MQHMQREARMKHFAGPWARGGRSEPPPAEDALAWILGALPDDWFIERPDITIDRDEILIVGRLPEPGLGEDATAAERASGEAGRIASFRESTRDRRIGIAKQAEHRYRRHDRAVHHVRGAGDDPVAPAGAAGAGHAHRRRGGPVPLGGAGLVRPPGRGARRPVARSAPRGHGRGRRAAAAGADAVAEGGRRRLRGAGRAAAPPRRRAARWDLVPLAGVPASKIYRAPHRIAARWIPVPVCPWSAWWAAGSWPG